MPTLRHPATALLPLIAGTLVFTASAAHAASAANTVLLDGMPLPNVEAHVDISIAVTEFREGGSETIRLLPGQKRYTVSLLTRNVIPALEAQLPAQATPARFTVATQNGRTFQSCLLHGLANESDDRKRLVYTLRCENVTGAGG